jgi:hypothetical protein
MANIDDLYDAVSRRECILFLGAGVHYPPPEDLPDYQYPSEDRPPLGAEFSRALARECKQRALSHSRSDPLNRARHSEKRLQRAKDLRAAHRFLLKHRDDLTHSIYFVRRARSPKSDRPGVLPPDREDRNG